MVYKITQIITPLNDSSCKCWWGQNIANKFLNELHYNVIITDEKIFNNLQYLLNWPHSNVIVLKNPKASMTLCNKLAKKIDKGSNIMAIGSGTVNDIAKYVSCKVGGSYSIIASALSMNGYTSSNASLVKNGIKQSFAAHLPQNVIFDSNILTQAPKHLTLAGFYDCLSSVTANFDWLLSNIVLKTPYNNKYYKLIKPLLKRLINKMHLKTLAQCVVLGGFAMHTLKTSAPASGFEHMLAHNLEKQKTDVNFNKLPHGLQIERFLKYCYKMQINLLQKLEKERVIIKNYCPNSNQIHKSFGFSRQQAEQISLAKTVDYYKFTKKDFAKLNIIYKNIDLDFVKTYPISQSFAIKTPLSRDRYTVGDLIGVCL